MNEDNRMWQRNLRDPYSVPLAITHLKNYLEIPRSVSQAMAVLRQLDYNSPLYRLYRRYFPLQWASSVAGVRSCNGEGYTPREMEFLRLVEQQLFPLDCDYLLDMAAEGGRTECIQLLPYATRWYDEPQEMSQSWQLLLMVSGSLHPDEALSLLLDMPENVLEPSIHKALKDEVSDKRGSSWTGLKDLCAQTQGPLTELALTFSLMLFNTGNEWLDVTGEDGTAPFDSLPLRWCEPHVDLLSRTFHEAVAMEQRTQSLADWVEADPNRHMKEILDLLQRAKISAEPTSL